MSQTQKALFLESKGGEFKLRERDIPAVIPGWLLVRVEAVGVNPIDWKVQKHLGAYISNYPAIVGVDVAGVVTEVGADVSGFTVGDRVFFQGLWENDRAGFQQYTLAEAALAAKIPANVSFDEAASLSVGVATATVGLYLSAPHGAGKAAPFEDSARGKYAGSPLVVFGGSSSVGQYVIQLAKLSGFSPIIATASLKHTEHIKSLGATHVLDRNLSSDALAAEVAKITTAPIKLVFDAVSVNDTQKSAFNLLADDSDLILLLDPEEIKATEGKRLTRIFGNWIFPHSRDLGLQLYSKLSQLLEEGSIKPNRVEVIPGGLNGVLPALARLEANDVSGAKLIVRPQETA